MSNLDAIANTRIELARAVQAQEEAMDRAEALIWELKADLGLA